MTLLSCKFSNTEMPQLKIQNVCLHRMIHDLSCTSLSWFLPTNRCSFTLQNMFERFMCYSIDRTILYIRSRAVDFMKRVLMILFLSRKLTKGCFERVSPHRHLYSHYHHHHIHCSHWTMFYSLSCSISVVTTSQIRIEWCIFFRVTCHRHPTPGISF